MSDVVGARSFARVAFGALMVPYVSWALGQLLFLGVHMHRCEKTLAGCLLLHRICFIACIASAEVSLYDDYGVICR